jgi:CheY-like chemotaxis protein
MNSSQPDENEHVIDIFVLTKCPPVSSSLAQALGPAGYRLTVFPEGEPLITALNEGRPNLLVCDATDRDPAVYDLCRQLKSDDRFWMVPVLIVSGTSSLEDLLCVLDCNAESYIPHPADPQRLVSLVEGLLSSPVERPSHDQARTQFRVNHDGRTFLVLADRRKLLEFLLSAFEVAAGKSVGLIQAEAKIRQLHEEIAHLQIQMDEDARKAGILADRLGETEESERSFRQSAEALRQMVSAKENAIGTLERTAKENRDMFARAEEHIRSLGQEREELVASHEGEVTLLQQHLEASAREIEGLRRELDAAHAHIGDEKSKRAEAEASARHHAEGRSAWEETAARLTEEVNRLTREAAAGRERAERAEEEVKSALEEHEKVRGELESEIGRIRKEAGIESARTAREIDGLKAARDAEAARAVSAEERAAVILQAKEAREASLITESDSLRRELSEIRERLDAGNAGTEKEAERRRLAERERDEAIAARTAAENMAGSLKLAIGEIQAALDARQERVQLLESRIEVSEAANEKIRSDMKSVSAALEEKEQMIAAERDARAGAETHLGVALREKDEISGTVRELQEGLQAAKAETEAGRVQAERELQAASARIRDLEADIAAAVQAHGELQTVSRQNAQSLEAAAEDIRGERDAAAARIALLEKEIAAIQTEIDDARQEARGTSDELEQVREQLEVAREERRLAGERREVLAREREELESELADMKGRLLGLSASFSKEKEAAEEKIETALARIRALEQETAGLRKARDDAQHKAEELAAEIDQARSALADEWEDHMNADEEIDQARSALADEWEDHMNADERLADVGLRTVSVEPARQQDAAAGQATTGSLVARQPDMPPRVIPPRQSSLAPVDIPRPLTGISERSLMPDDPSTADGGWVNGLAGNDENAKGNDFAPAKPFDIFEEPEARAETGSAPDASGATVAGETILENEDLYDSRGSEVSEVEENGDILPEIASAPATQSGMVHPHQALPGGRIDRTQWLTILKWARHAQNVSRDQRMQILKVGRLLEKGRRLTPKQEQQVYEMIDLIEQLGFRP